MKNEWKQEAERLLFDFGKVVLGKNAGGMITKLIRERGFDAARTIIKMAAGKSDPREYVGAAMRERAESELKHGDVIGNHRWDADWKRWRKLEDGAPSKA